MSLDNGYKYKFTDDYITIIYDDFVNKLADHFGGELTKDQCNAALRALSKEPYEKWFGEIDEICYILHFLDKNGVDKVTVVGKGFSLYD